MMKKNAFKGTSIEVRDEKNIHEYHLQCKKNALNDRILLD